MYVRPDNWRIILFPKGEGATPSLSSTTGENLWFVVDGMGWKRLASLGNMVIRPGENTTNLREILNHLTFHIIFMFPTN